MWQHSVVTTPTTGRIIARALTYGWCGVTWCWLVLGRCIRLHPTLATDYGVCWYCNRWIYTDGLRARTALQLLQ